MAIFPGSLPPAGTAVASDTLAAAGHTALHNTSYDEIRAIATKIGTGSSTPTASTVLRGTGAGTSAWGQAALTTDVTGTLPVANGGTGVTSSTGSGANVLGTAPTLDTPAITNFSSATHTHASNAYGGQLSGTTALLNTTVTADKLNLGPTKKTVSTSETTNSTGYVALATAQSTSITVGANGLLLIGIKTTLQNDTITQEAHMSFAMSGTNTLSASDANDIMYITPTAGYYVRPGAVFLMTGLNPGATTVTAQFRVSGGIGTFSQRDLWAVPL